jgi:hypothetical protein
MSVTSAGDFTGKIALPGLQYHLKGTFSSLGTYAAIQAEGKAILDVFLNVNGAQPSVSGTVTAATSNSATAYGVQCALLRTYTAKTIPSGLAGYYTAMIPAVTGTDPTLPDAPGYGVMNVSKTGAIHIDGKLGDGASYNVRSQLDADGKTWTFYTTLYGGKTPGILAGTMTFGDLAGSDCAGTLDWNKNVGNAGYYSGGFGVPVILSIAKYSPPALATGTTSGTLVFAGGNLSSSSTDSLTISTTDKVTVKPADSDTTLSITPSTGVFTGKFPYGLESKKLSFGGVFYTKPTPSPEGFGLFLGSSEIGSVTIKP